MVERKRKDRDVIEREEEKKMDREREIIWMIWTEREEEENIRKESERTEGERN